MKNTKKILGIVLALIVLTLVMSISVFAADTENVAKVGDTEYATIDEAIAAWSNNTTLTLLSDVTLSDVVTLKSTEHHILNLGTYTLTAADGKNAFVIQACGTGDSERSAITINADATNPGGINAGSKCVVYYKYADGGITGNDRPIIKINGGVFTGSTSSWGSAGIYTIGTEARKCATVNVTGGTFNCSIVGSGKSKLIISGGTFNYTVSSQGDSTCSRLISGGTFKTLGFMTADSNNTKFWIGTEMGNSNVGTYIDDNGYIVVGGPVVTEPGGTFEASSSNYSGASSYLQYSSAAEKGLYYTSVEEAFADNNKASGSVTVHVEELDMTGIDYKGTIVVPNDAVVNITYSGDAANTWTVTNKKGDVLVDAKTMTSGTIAVAPSSVEVATFDELVTELANGNSVKLTADITTTSAINTSGLTALIDLNGYTLTIGAGDNKFNDASNITIQNGTINITGVTANGNAIFCLDEYEKELVTTLTLNNVNVTGNGYSSAYGVFYIGPASVLNVNGGEWNLTNDTSSAGGVFKADASTAELNIADANMTLHNVRRVVTYADTVIDNSTIAISGDENGVDAEMEHGFNRSPLVINDSTVTMKDMVGRGITAQNGAVEITGTSSVTMTNCQEATIDVRNSQTVTVAETATVKLDAEPTIANGSAINGSLILPPKADKFSYGFVKEVGGFVRVWGEAYGCNASESFVIKLYCGDKLLATTELNNIGNIIDGDIAEITWNFFYPSSNDAYWTTTWAAQPNSAEQPDKVVLYVDGVKVAENEVQMNGPDSINQVKWRELGGVAVADLEGEGTIDNPYLITKLDELKWFRDDVNAGNDYDGKYVKLMANIDLAGENWLAIGAYGSHANNKTFRGYFDGNNKIISNLTISDTTDAADMLGLFGHIHSDGMNKANEPSVKNLTLTNVNISSTDATSRIGGLAANPYTCYIKNVHVQGTISGGKWTGGIAGNCYAVYEDCSFKGSVTSNNQAGGIAGAGDARVYNCLVEGDITAKYWAGGIVGNGQEGASVVGCYVKGTIKATNNWYRGVGGIAGVAGHGYNGSEYTNNYFDGEVYLADEKIPAVVAGFVNAESNETINTTVSGNSWNTAYYPVNTPVYITAEVTSDATTADWIASASEEKSSERNNNLVMLESDLAYVDAKDIANVTKMSFSTVEDEDIEQIVIDNNAVAQIGNVKYQTFAEALAAANAMTGDVEVIVYGEVEFVNGMELNGSYASIKFVGADSSAKITINQSAGGDYLEAHGKTVVFENLTLAKANPAWSGNSGHMGNYFSIQGGNVTYNNCTFSNGACTSGGTATYNNCTFNNTVEYGLWVYDDALVTVNGGTIDSVKGIKVYSEDESTVTSTLTVQNATFTEKVTAKPAVAIGYASQITLIGNTYNNTTGVLELDTGADANCEGIEFVAQDANGNDIAKTITAVDRSNSNAACGVLVDGKIYTTVAEAAAAAEKGSTVTLLHNSTENVEFAIGVTLNKNDYTADGVTVAKAVAKIGEVEYSSLQAAVDAAQNGETITLLGDIEQADGVTISNKNITIDLNSKTFTVTLGGSTNNRNFKIVGTSEVTIKNGTMVAKGDYSSGACGTVRTEDSAVVTLENLALYNYRGNGLNIKAVGQSKVYINDTNIYSQYGGGIEAAGGTIELTNVNVEQKGMYTAPYNSMAISVNGGGKVTVNSGTYKTEILAESDDNNQGSTHGPWCVGVLSSGGTLIINGGTFTNDNFGDNSLATAARGLILADTGAVVEIYGGTFNALKSIVDIQNNLGDASKNPTGIIVGGTFSADPTNDYVKLADGKEANKNADGTYTIIDKLDVDGTGTAEDPYIIDSVDDLYALANRVNSGISYKGEYFKLANDIDLTMQVYTLRPTANWTPIGTLSAPFMGTFDGDGKTISNMIVVGDTHQGFFGYADLATIKNINFVNVTVIGTDCVGAVAGNVYSSSLIDNCHVSGRIQIEGQTNVGGIVGKYYTKVTNCSVIGDGAATSYVKGVYVAADLEGDNIGGIMGHCGENNTLTNNVVKNITISGTRKVGGIGGVTGQQTDVSGCVVENVVIETTATVDYANDNKTKMSIGAILGQYQAAGTTNDGTVTNCTVKNVTFNNVNNVTVDIGPIVGGARGGTDGMLAPSANVVASGNYVYMSTITGATNDYLMVAVAKIGDVNYYTLLDAVVAVNAGETITLVSDVTESITVPAGKKFTLDLGGNTLNGSILAPNAELTVENGSIVNNNSGASALEINAGVLIINNVEISSARHGVRIDGAVDATINSGKFFLLSTITGTRHALNISGAATVTINGGTFIGPKGIPTSDSGSAVCVQTGAKVTINGGSFSGGKNATIGVSGTAVIYGGTYDQNVSAFCADGYAAFANGDGTYSVAKVIAQIGSVPYKSLEEAFKAATSGCTIEILADVTIDYKWDARYTGSSFNVPVTIDGNNHTIKFTGSISDPNTKAAFIFKEAATIKNLTIDVSKSDAQRVVASKLSITVDNCTFIGNDTTRYGVIFGEGAGTAISNVTATITNTKFYNFNKAISDNANAQDAKSVSITDCYFENGDVNVSANTSITFNDNEMVSSYVKMTTYTSKKLTVTAQNNTIDAEGLKNSFINAVYVNAQADIPTYFIPVGSLSAAYTSSNAIWGECGGNAHKSFVLEIYDQNGNRMGYTSLNNIGGIINGNVNVTWSINLNPSNADGYWTMVWDVAPSIANVPTTVKQVVDGTVVAQVPVQLNGPDGLNKIYAATTDANGNITKYHTSLNDAIANANGNDVIVLRDVTESIASIENVKLVSGSANGVTFTNTCANWIYVINLTIGDGVTLKAGSFFYDGGVNVIEGTLSVGTLYNGYNAKTTVQNGGNIATTGMIVVRYNTDAEAGLYIYGDGNDSTVEVSCADTIGAYSGTFYAKDAVVEGNMLWLDYKEGSTEEADKYAVINAVFENSKLNVAKELRLYKDASLTVINSAVTAGKVQVRENAIPTVSVDANSSVKASSVENLAGATLNAVLGADGTVSFVVSGLKGTGTENDPYIINNVEDLIFFRDSVNAGETKYNAEGVYVALTADINMASVENWAPIGTFDYSFDGNFNGNRKKIMNLKMSDNTSANGYAYLGFFGVTANNTVESFTIENVTINSNGQIVAAAIAYPYYTTVKNITVCGDIAIKGGNYTAGVLGYTRLCEYASNLTVSGNEGSYITGAQVVGGVIADIQMNKGLVANYSNFSVSGLTITGTKNVGGISGIIATQTLNGATVNNVTLVCNDNRVGIISGSLGGTSTIANVTYVNVTGATAVIGADYDGAKAIQAKIGDTYYATVADAFAAVNGTTATITVLADIATDSAIVVANGTTVTLDLNGKTITGTDNATGSFGLITNKGNLTINDTVGNGKITLTAKNNRGWSAYSSVISNTVGGKLVVENGTIEHLGGTDMAYAIDNLTNGKGTYAETVVNGGIVKSTYRAIRQFLNGVEAQNILTVNGGTIEGANKSIWLQDPNKNANSGTLTVDADAVIKGDIYLFVTEGSTEWPVSVSIANDAFDGTSTVVTGNVPAGYVVENANDTWGVRTAIYVAEVNGVQYESLAAAIAAANAGDTITLLADVTENVTINKDLTIDGAEKYYTGNISVKGTTVDVTVKNVKFINGTGYAITTNRIKSITVESCTVDNYYNYGFLYANKSTPTIVVKNVTVNGGNYGLNWNYGTEATLENVEMINVKYGIHTCTYGAKTITVKGCKIDAQYPIYVEQGVEAIDTFNFEGENTLANLSTSEYAKYVLADASAKLYATNSDLNVTTSVKGSAAKYVGGAYVLVPAVVKIGETYYASLQDAINAAQDGQTIVICQNYEMVWDGATKVDSKYAAMAVVEGKSVTIDLNGKNIEIDTDNASTTLFAAIAVDNGGNVTLVDSSEEKTGSIVANGNAKMYCLLMAYEQGAYLTIEGGNYSLDNASDSLVYAGGDKIITVNGGNFTLGNVGTGSNGKPWIFNVYGSADGSVYVTGGTFNADVNRQHWSSEVYVAKECYTVINDDGTYTVKEGAVAYVNTGMLTGPYFAPKDVGYATFEEALEAAITYNDKSITLLSDIVLTGSVTIDKDAEVVLDLNGKTLSYTSNVAGEDMIVVKGSLTIDDSTETKAGKITYANTDTTGSNVTVSTISAEAGSTVVINNGTIENKTVKQDGSSIYSYAIDMLTNGSNGDVSVTINGGTVYSDYIAIRQFNNGDACKNTLVVNGGYIYGKNRAIQVHFKNNAAYTTITGGKIEAKDYSLCLLTTSENISVQGGEFIGDVWYSGTTGFISGGTFDRAVYEEYCAVGYIPTSYVDDEGNTIYTVKEGKYVAQVGDTKFESLAEAINAGGTVVLLADVVLEDALTVNGTVVLDLAGYTISQEKAQTAAYSMIVVKGDLTIKDSVGNGKISYKDTTVYTSDVNYVSNTIINNGKLTIESGIIENASDATVADFGYPHAIDNNGALIINGGTISCETYSAIRVWCNEDDDTSVEVNGGVISGKNSIDMHNVNGKANKGTLTVNGGELSKIRFLGFGADVDEITISITGGKIDELVVINYVGADEAVLAEVYNVSGGTFSSPVLPAYCAEGYAPAANADGTYSVVEHSKFDIVYTNVNLGKDLAITFAIPASEFDFENNSYYAILKKCHKENCACDAEVVYVEVTETLQSGKWVYIASNNIAAKEMICDVEIVIYNGTYTENADGTVTETGYAISNARTQSVVGYVENAIDYYTTGQGVNYAHKQELFTLLADMLVYGAAAQNEFGHYNNIANGLATNVNDNIKTFVEANRTPTDVIPTISSQKSDAVEVGGKYFLGYIVELENTIYFDLVYGNVDVSNFNATVEFEHNNGDVHKLSVSEGTLKWFEKDGYLYISIIDLAPADIRGLVKCTIYDGNGQQISYVERSVEHYLATAIERLPEKAELFYDIMRYSDSARAYFDATKTN